MGPKTTAHFCSFNIVEPYTSNVYPVSSCISGHLLRELISLVYTVCKELRGCCQQAVAHTVLADLGGQPRPVQALVGHLDAVLLVGAELLPQVQLQLVPRVWRVFVGEAWVPLMPLF